MQSAPYGSWPSPLRAETVAASERRLGAPRVHGGSVWWLERRPEEGGRQVVVRAAPGRAPEDATPRGWNARSRVHEYGGGDYLPTRDGLLCVDGDRPGVWRLAVGGPRRVAGGAATLRHADPATSPDARWLAAVEEEHGTAGEEPANRLVLFDLADAGRRHVVDDRHDFVSSPRFAPDGRRLAWLAWDHPRMPWDGTELLVADFHDGAVGPPRVVAGGPEESVFQPEFSPAGRLTFVSDRSGFWNLHQERDGGVAALCPRDAEFGRPQWALGMRTYAFVAEDVLVCTVCEEGRDRLARLDAAQGRLEDLPLSVAQVDGIDAEGALVAVVGAATDAPPAVHALDLRRDTVATLRQGFALALDPALVARPEARSFASRDGRPVHAFLYRPERPDVRPPAGERPPLRVRCHGGPTGHVAPGLDLAVQYWTTRGVAVLDVNYAGSTGHGRAYRELLRGAWGVVDVEDVVAAATAAAEEGLADPARLLVRGGSAGGFTALCALTFFDRFAAGASLYGIGDLEALVRETHKFESRYLEGLVAPWPAGRDVYRARSPLHHADRLTRPVIFFQGLEDPVVPPGQSAAMAAALRARGVPHALLTFAGESHGFRRAETIRTVLEAELAFYGRILGFATDAALPLAIESERRAVP